MPNITAKYILDFWFSDRVKPLHFRKDVAFDREVYDTFFPAYEQASQGKLDDWRETALGSLALIILLDQFPRNMFRNSSQSFDTDRQACAISRSAIDKGFDDELTQEQCVFLYMPLMHSENLVDQEFCVTQFTKLGIESNLKFAIAHRNIVRRFNRFPHRNNILGRDSTPEEIEFLTEPNSSF